MDNPENPETQGTQYYENYISACVITILQTEIYFFF